LLSHGSIKFSNRHDTPPYPPPPPPC
jgi:hypothetical protein